MAQNKNFEMILDLMLNMNFDKSQVQKISSQIEKEMKAIEPDVEIDGDEIAEEVLEALRAFEELSDIAEKVDKTISDMEMDMDLDEAEKGLLELEDIFKNLDVNMFDDEFNEELNKVADKLKGAFEDLSATKAKKEIDSLAESYVKSRQKAEELLSTQKLALIEMERTGKSGTTEYANLKNKIAETESEVKKFADALEKVANDNKSDLEKLADSFDKTKKETEELLATQKLALAEMKRTGQVGTKEFEELEKAVNDTEQEIKQLNEALDGVEVDIETENFDSLMARFEALGNLGNGLTEFADKGQETRKSLREIQVQADLTNEELEQYRDLANDVFDPKVEGLETVGKAIKNLGTSAQFLKDNLDPEQLAQYTSYAGKFGNVFDEDVNEVIKKGASAVKEYNLESSQFFGYLTETAQNGGTAQNDLLDSVAEYSVHFKSAGFAAEEMFSILGKGGTGWNLDYIGDAVKELNIRLTQGDLRNAMEDIFEDMPEELKSSLDSTLTLAEQGNITVAEMFKQMNQTVIESYDSGSITKQLTGQIQNALAGTKPEDLTIEKYNEIFQPKIDTEQFKKDSQEALALLDDNIGSQTIFDDFNKQFEILKTKASEIFSPFIAGAGQAMTSLSELAPGLLVLQNTDLSKMKQQFAGIGNTLKGLSSQAGALGKLGPALFNPWTLGITAAAAGLTLFFTKTERGQEVFKRLSESVKGIIKKLEPVFEGLMVYLEKGLDYLFALGELIYEVVITPIEFLWELIATGIDLFSELTGSTNDSSDAFDMLGNGLKNAGQVFSYLADVLRNFVKYISYSKDTVIGFIRNLPELLSVLWDYAKFYLNPVNWIDGDDDKANELSERLGNVIKKSMIQAKENLSKEEKIKVDDLMELEDVNNKNDDNNKQPPPDQNEATKTAIELANELYNSKVKEYDLAHKQYKLAQEQAIYEANRERNVNDELILQQDKLSTLEKQKQALLETYKVVEDNEGNITVGIKGADKQDIREKLLSIEQSIQDQKESVRDIEVGIKLSEKEKAELQREVNQQLEDLKIKQLEIDIDAGVNIDNSFNQLIEIYQNRLSDVQSLMQSLNLDTVAGQQEYIELKNQEIDLLQTINSITDQQKEKRQDIIEAETKTIEENYNERMSKVREFNDMYLKLTSEGYGKERESSMSNLVKEEEDKIKNLDELRELDLLSEEDYNNRKELIQEATIKKQIMVEEDYQRKISNATAIARGNELEVERRYYEEKYTLQKQALETEISLLEQKQISGTITEQEQIELDKLNDDLDNINDLLISKGSLIGVTLQELQSGIEEGIAGMFSGNGTDAMLENAREFFGVLAGILEKKASAFVVDWILSSSYIQAMLSALPFPADVAALATIRNLVNAGVKGILDPVLQNILSFATGGSIAGAYDSPQIIQVGDASNVGGRNAEWVTRDVDIQAIVTMTVNQMSNVMASKLTRIENAINNLQLETRITGRQLKVVLNREANYEKSVGY
jgi:phage-related minor tail protein